jgi:hypothetical protein
MLWRNREGKQVATITEWLASLGLPEYAQRFAENGIDASVLRYLTDQDLEKIGVLLGHRRKMLAAIAELASAVAEEKVASFWIERATFSQGCILASTGKPSDAVQLYVGARHIAGNGNDILVAVVSVLFRQSACGTGQIRRCVALHW